MITGIPDAVSGGLSAAKGQMSALTKSAGHSCSLFSNLSAMIDPNVSGMFSDLQEGITDVMTLVGNTIKQANKLIDDAAALFDKLLLKVSDFTDGIIGEINATFSAVSRAVSRAFAAVSDATAKMMQEIDNAMDLLADGVSAMVSSSCHMVQKAMTNIGDGASDFIDMIGGSATEASKNVAAAGAASMKESMSRAADDAKAGISSSIPDNISLSLDSLSQYL